MSNSIYKHIIAPYTFDQYDLWTLCSDCYECLSSDCWQKHLFLFLLEYKRILIVKYTISVDVTSVLLSLCQFCTGSAITLQIMTGNHGAAPGAPGTPVAPTAMPNATATQGQGQHQIPNKFMSELHRAHSELDCLTLT